MSTHAVYLPVVFAAGAALFVWFYRLARRQRHVVMVTFILGLIVVETTLYSSISVPIGIFHPSLGALQIRTIDIIILVALASSALAGPMRRQISPPTLLWLVFGVWLITEALFGVMAGNSRTYVGYELKILLYLALMVLASRVSLRDPRTRTSLERLFFFASTVSALTLTLGAAGVQSSINVPGLRGAQIGQIGSTAAAFYVSIGALALAVAVTSEIRRFPLLLAAVPLLLPPLMAHQRASLLNLLVCVAAIVALLPLARHRLRATFMEVVLVFLAALALVSLPVLVEGAVEGRRVIPFSGSLSRAISSREKQLSAQDRINQLVEARRLIAEKPILGWGLGKTINYYEVGFKEFQDTYLTHNIVSDLLLRTGIIGLLLFVLAMGASLARAIRTWRAAWDPLIAAIALGSCSVLAGWLAHGTVESLFEHVQLAPLLGICLGFVQAAARERSEPATETALAPEPRLVPIVLG